MTLRKASSQRRTFLICLIQLQNNVPQMVLLENSPCCQAFVQHCGCTQVERQIQAYPFSLSPMRVVSDESSPLTRLGYTFRLHTPRLNIRDARLNCQTPHSNSRRTATITYIYIYIYISCVHIHSRMLPTMLCRSSAY